MAEALARDEMDTQSSGVDRAGDTQARQPDWLGPTLVGFGLAILIGVLYQLMVGGIKIEITGGHLTVDASGFLYWWRTSR